MMESKVMVSGSGSAGTAGLIVYVSLRRNELVELLKCIDGSKRTLEGLKRTLQTLLLK